MQPQPATLESARSRTLLYGSYVVWAITATLVVVAANLYLTAADGWLALVERTRAMFGLAPVVGAPDWWLIGAAALAVLVPVAVAIFLYALYRRVWNRRLMTIWGPSGGGMFERVRTLPYEADPARTTESCQYLARLLASERWRSSGITVEAENGDGYRAAADRVLGSLEADVARRAWSLGLVVGLSHRGWLDSLAIAGAAFELQLHVMTSLGKRPSIRGWMRLWERAAASLFVNWYLNGEESLTFRLMIRKIGFGLQAGSELVEHAADALSHWDAAPDDIDWDDVEHLLPEHVAGVPVRPFARLTAMSAGALISVGAFGMQQLGRFIERCGEDLFQGAVAATILHGHGIALAADCLALDRRHRESPFYSPRIHEVMTRMCYQAGAVLNAQVRELRRILRDRRRMLVKVAKERSGSLASSVKSAVSGAFGKARSAGKSLFTSDRAEDTEPPVPGGGS